MSSVRRVQIERALEDAVYAFYSQGAQPLTSELIKSLNTYFSKYPAGAPLPLPLKTEIAGSTSDTDKFGELISFTEANLDVLYESCVRQINQILQFISSSRQDLARLKKRRIALETLIDDFLLSNINTDGYFYAIGESFSDLSKVDLALTSTQVDTVEGKVVLPSVPYSTSRLDASNYQVANVVTHVNGEKVNHKSLSPFENAINTSMNNIFWALEVEVDKPSEVVLNVSVSLSGEHQISSMTIDPYGITPVQMFISAYDDSQEEFDFGNLAITTTRKTTFTSTNRVVKRFVLTMRKTEYDYTQRVDGKLVYRYIFGAKSLSADTLIFDPQARLVSTPLGIDEDMAEDAVIDAVSLEVNDSIPDGTDIKYYIGASTGSESEDFSDISWQAVTPVNRTTGGKRSVRFDGALQDRKIVRREVDDSIEDVELIPLKNTGPISELNPSPSIIPGVTKLYRITEINERAFKRSMKVLEGLNTVRVHSRTIEPNLNFDDVDLAYWANQISNNPNVITTDYARIDAGNNFFYGGDVGAVQKDVYVEAFLRADTTFETLISQFAKNDANSTLWDVKVFLNGRELARIEPGSDIAQLPWNIREGLNHVVLLIRMEQIEDISVFLGSVTLMVGDRLFNYGKVRLNELVYVDPFELTYNEAGHDTLTFTIINNEIVTRRPLTDNYEVSYSIDSGQGPEFVRLRAELSRDGTVPYATPILNSYRMRFAYGEEN